MTEADLRDELSKRLDLLEPGLTLRAVEFRLPNHQGASGSIDILAADRFSATVIIEIEKSNQTARQALHELHKYLALIKIDHGLRDSQLRCILVSTEWHELLIPFSEFSRTALWAIDGFRLFSNPDGNIDHADKVVPVNAPTPMRLCPEHKIYFFQEKALRDEALPVLMTLLDDHNLCEYLLLKLDCNPRRFEGACDFALYLIVPEFDSEERQRARKWLANTEWKGDLEEPIRYLEEQLVIAEVTDAFFDHCDEREIGYPEKLVSICQDWDLAALIRGGPRLQLRSFSPTTTCCGGQKAWRAAMHIGLKWLQLPRRTLPWSEVKENADYTLLGNEAWRTVLRRYLKEIETEHPAAIVTARIHNPCDLMMGLYRLAKLQTGDTLPAAELIVSLQNDSPARVVFGALVWNGRCVRTIVEVLPDEVPTLFDLYMAGAIDGGTWRAEEHLVAKHGLEYVLVEGELISGEMTWRQLTMDSGRLQRVEITDRKLESFAYFYEAHQDYLQTLVRDFDSWASFG